jgi:hypothetical protein
VTINVTVWNSGEPAFLAYAFISLPAPCFLVRVPDTCHICDGDGDGDDDDDEDNAKSASTKKLCCLMGNPIHEKEKVSRLPALSAVSIIALRNTTGLYFVHRRQGHKTFRKQEALSFVAHKHSANIV